MVIALHPSIIQVLQDGQNEMISTGQIGLIFWIVLLIRGDTSLLHLVPTHGVKTTSRLKIHIRQQASRIFTCSGNDQGAG